MTSIRCETSLVGFSQSGPHPAHLGRSVNGREIELLLGGVEGEHQVEDFFLRDFGRAVFLVDFVHDHNGLEPQFDGFSQDEARLRHGSFEGVHDEQDGIRHLQYALDFTAKVSVTRGVEDVDLDALPVSAHVFGQDGDPAFALEVVVVQDQFTGFLAGIDGLALVDDVVDQGGFAVVNVGDDGDVSNAVHGVARKGNSFRGAKNVQTFAEYYKSCAIFAVRFARMAELVDAHDSNSCS